MASGIALGNDRHLPPSLGVQRPASPQSPTSTQGRGLQRNGCRCLNAAFPNLLHHPGNHGLGFCFVSLFFLFGRANHSFPCLLASEKPITCAKGSLNSGCICYGLSSKHPRLPLCSGQIGSLSRGTDDLGPYPFSLRRLILQGIPTWA